MESYFWVGEVLDNFLFKGVNTTSWTGLLGVCTVLSCLALVYEGLHVLKLFFLHRFIKARKAFRRQSNGSSHNDGTTSSSLSRPFISRHHRTPENGSGERAPRSLLEESDNTGDETIQTVDPSRGFLDLGISSVFHGVYMFLGFTLMNAVMTFNVWVLVAISIGIAGGYFFFGNYRREENLIQPLRTETTSLNDDSGSQPPLPMDGSGDRLIAIVSPSRTPITTLHQERNGELDDPGENSRLIVGAEVHAPKMSTSAAST